MIAAIGGMFRRDIKKQQLQSDYRQSNNQTNTRRVQHSTGRLSGKYASAAVFPCIFSARNKSLSQIGAKRRDAMRPRKSWIRTNSKNKRNRKSAINEHELWRINC
ncbi:MAG: hypothetical protein WAW41_10865 [Methylobacter sp.]